MRQEPHIPLILGLLILIIGLGGLIILTEKGPGILSRAGIQTTPEEITVSNVTDTGFTFSWLTQAPTTGALVYEEASPLGQSLTAYDIRDIKSKTTARYSHHVRIDKLKPDTEYSITLVNNNLIYEKKYRVRTGLALSIAPIYQAPAFGTLIDNFNSPVPEALVLLSFNGSQTLSTLTNADGSWLLPLSPLRSAAGNRYFQAGSNLAATLLFIGKNGKSTVTATTDYLSPLTPIRLGENYNFLVQSWQRLWIRPVYAAENEPGQILQPADAAVLPYGRPEFKGKAQPEQQILLVLSGPQIISQHLTANNQGLWTYVPLQPLVPGNYTFTATWLADGKAVHTQGINFKSLKSGTSVLGDATPSATVRPSASASITLRPSARPTASVSARPQATLPTTGNSTPGILVLSLGALLLFSGLVYTQKKLYSNNR